MLSLEVITGYAGATRPFPKLLLIYLRPSGLWFYSSPGRVTLAFSMVSIPFLNSLSSAVQKE